MKNKIYIAGSLFKEADINQRLKEEKQLKSLIKSDVKIYNPINADINDKSLLPTAKQILLGDFKQILESNYLLCALDDNDIGQAVEIGMAFGINYILNEIKQIIKSNQNEILDKITKMLEEIPSKTFFSHHSDIRIKDANKYEQDYVPYGINQFLIGAIEYYGKIYRSSNDAIEDLVKNINKF